MIANVLLTLTLLGSPALAQEPAEAPPAQTVAAEELREEVRALREELRRLEAEMRTRGGPPPELGEVDGVLPGPGHWQASPPPPVPAVAPAPPAPPPPPVAGPERVSFGAGPVRVLAGERVAEAVGFGTDVVVDGLVDGDAVSFGGSVYVKDGAEVGGDAVSFGGRVVVEPGGVLRGDRVNLGAAFSPFANGGPPDHLQAHDRPHHEGVEISGPITRFLTGLYHKLVFLLAFAGAGVLVVGLFPNRVSRVAQAIEERPLQAAGLGVIGTLVGVLGAVLFAITILGIPVSLLLVALLGLAWLLGFVGLCQMVGDRLPVKSKPHGRWIAFLGGVLLVSFVGALPFVGWLAVLAVSMLGIGAAFATRFGSPPAS